ncbi:carbohydrate ABC transporter permease [Bacillus marinisedimentorum]|uniref:carbohydrate ABC transporter permease n=1 Tax=Bacillus marinisedimentorum TaxID=1821260 RepID=UPI0007E1D357|nr:sugar ABC transporter permease [Bacillus marinisedimentorum]
MRLNKNLAPYVFVSPFYLLFAVFMLYPLVFSLYMSFTEWNGIGEMRWVGFQNYKALFSDDVFVQSLWNALILFVMYVPVMLFFALVLAVVLNTGLVKFQRLFRTIYITPYITSLVAIGFTFVMIYDKDYGLLNMVLQAIGIPEINWLGTVWGARFALASLIIWRWVGYNMIIMLAGLQNIPNELYEAATVDGAGKIRSFFSITVPMMKPVILFTAILSTVGTFMLFVEPLVLTQGGPVNSTITPVMYLYQQSFDYLKFGYASSMAYIFFILIFIASLIQIKVFGKE